MMKIVAMQRPSKMVVRAQASAAPAAKTLKALNVTKSKLVEELSTTRNIDGTIYTITLDPAADKIEIEDKTNRMVYDAEVGAKDNRISLIEETGRPLGGNTSAGVSFDALVPLLRGDSYGAEIINGRAAMAAFIGIVAVEIATGQPMLAQLTTPAGAAGAVALAVLTTVASVAPALTGAVAPERVLPSNKDPHSDRQLQYFWTPLGEVLNGRVAMLGLVGLAITEAVRGAALF